MAQEGETRRLKRMRALKGARLILASRTDGGVDCRVVDLNSHGARLRFDGPVPVGEQVEFILFPENHRIKGRRAWQKAGEKGFEIGVEFDRPLGWLERHDVKLAG